MTLTISPLATMYALQALTYGATSFFALRAGHCALSRCYAVSSLIHAGLAAAHVLHQS